MAKKTIELVTQDGADRFRTVWRNGERGMIDVDIYMNDQEVPLLEWSYPKLAGPSLIGNASVWEKQIIGQARCHLQQTENHN